MLGGHIHSLLCLGQQTLNSNKRQQTELCSLGHRVFSNTEQAKQLQFHTAAKTNRQATDKIQIHNAHQTDTKKEKRPIQNCRLLAGTCNV